MIDAVILESWINYTLQGITMKLNYFIRFTALLLLLSGLFLTSTAYPDNHAIAKKINVLIHISNNHKSTYQAALNYTYSLREHYDDKVNIAIVANGPGIGFVNANNHYTDEIKVLLKEGVKISACNTTVRIMRKFQDLPIIKGVKFVATGVVEVIELQRKGYLYLNP